MKCLCLFLIFKVTFAALYSFHEELFESGQFANKQQDPSLHLSSSTEDLKLLFEAEKNLVSTLESNFSLFIHEAKFSYLDLVDFELTQNSLDYVKHPINAFHMLQRLDKYLPKLSTLMPSLKFNFSLTNQDCAQGIADLQEFHGLNPLDLINGQIKANGQIFEANSKLTSDDALKIAKAARNSEYYQGYVEWCKAILKVEKSEKFQIAYENAKRIHDDNYMKINVKQKWNNAPKVKIHPYNSLASTQKQEELFEISNKFLNSRFDDLFSEKIDKHQDILLRFDVFLRSRIQKLCNGKYDRDAKLEKDLRCFWLHQNNPYLKLAPFKLEVQHHKPEIAIIHDFASSNELKIVKEAAKGHMKSTPYVTGGKEDAYSKLRTSKVMYMNEKLAPEISSLSQKIEQATRYKMKSEIYASENFQVMNYGMGGRISGHLDSQGYVNGLLNSEDIFFGGFRVTTFMVYLSSVEAGGHTVFPQAGISVKPEEGKALFWFNAGSDGGIDSRIYHLGCPVLYGNKWIANKWVKILAQYKNYPCFIKDKYFSVMTKNQTSVIN